MAFKPNYRQQRSERTRSKEAKKQEKLAKREADAAKRRAEREAAGLSPAEGADGSPRPTAAGDGSPQPTAAGDAGEAAGPGLERD